MPIIEESRCRLDPILGPRLQFQRRGQTWVLAGRPCRLAAQIVEDERGRRLEVLDPATGRWIEDEAA